MSLVKARTVTAATSLSPRSGTPRMALASMRTPTIPTSEPRIPLAAHEGLSAAKFIPATTQARQLGRTIEVISLLSDDEDDTTAMTPAATATVPLRARGESGGVLLLRSSTLILFHLHRCQNASIESSRNPPTSIYPFYVLGQLVSLGRPRSTDLFGSTICRGVGMYHAQVDRLHTCWISPVGIMRSENGTMTGVQCVRS